MIVASLLELRFCRYLLDNHLLYGVVVEPHSTVCIELVDLDLTSCYFRQHEVLFLVRRRDTLPRVCDSTKTQWLELTVLLILWLVVVWIAYQARCFRYRVCAARR